MVKILLILLAAYLTGALPLHLWALGRPASHFTLYRREIFLVIVIDLVKGMAAALFGLALAGWMGACLAAVFVVVGSMYSVFQGFRGGYGLSVAAGALLILSPVLILFGIIVYFISLLATRYLFVSTLLTTIVMMIAGLVLATHFYALAVILITGGLILLRTRPDWRRFRRKIEPPYRFKNPFRRIH